MRTFRDRALDRLGAERRKLSGMPLPLGLGGRGANVIFERPRRVEGRSGIFLGQSVSILGGSWLAVHHNLTAHSSEPARLEIRDGVYIGRNCSIHAGGKMVIGRNTTLADNVFVTDVSHPAPDPGTLLSVLDSSLLGPWPVSLGEGCFIGTHSVILPGVTLGDACSVGANSVVTRSFPAGSVIAGAPARAIAKDPPSA